MAAMTERICECCRKPFSARTADVRRGWARYCSKRCKAIKQEAKSHQYAEFLANHSDREFSDAQADGSWDEHKIWSGTND